MPQPELDLATDASFQTAEWRAQRIGWGIWSLIIVAACLGLLGPGWLSHGEVASADGAVTVGFERFLHYHHPTQVRISCRGDQLDGKTFRISIQRTLLDRLQIRQIEPEPEHRQATQDGVTYEFQRDPQAGDFQVVFHVEYERYGAAAGDVALAGSAPVSLKQFVYP